MKRIPSMFPGRVRRAQWVGRLVSKWPLETMVFAALSAAAVAILAWIAGTD